MMLKGKEINQIAYKNNLLFTNVLFHLVILGRGGGGAKTDSKVTKIIALQDG
jgi:hypothetical protein